MAPLNEKGDRFRFELARSLPEGAEITVFGYTDVTSPCSAEAVEVIAFTLKHLPPPEGLDLIGNLLGDDWHRYFFPGQTVDPFGDADGDGATELRE